MSACVSVCVCAYWWEVSSLCAIFHFVHTTHLLGAWAILIRGHMFHIQMNSNMRSIYLFISLRFNSKLAWLTHTQTRTHCTNWQHSNFTCSLSNVPFDWCVCEVRLIRGSGGCHMHNNNIVSHWITNFTFDSCFVYIALFFRSSFFLFLFFFLFFFFHLSIYCILYTLSILHS